MNNNEDELSDDLNKKVGSLEERISSVRNEYDRQKEQHEGRPAEDQAFEIRLGRHIASLFLGNVVAGLVLGLAADKYLGTAPWGLMFCIILGLIGGVYRAQNAIDK